MSNSKQSRLKKYWPMIRAGLKLPGNMTVSIPAVLVTAGLLTVHFAHLGGFWDTFLSVHMGWGLPGYLAFLPVIAFTMTYCVGAWLLFHSNTIFARHGETLDPGDPTIELITEEGPYQYIRHSMFLGVYIMLLSEAAVTGSFLILCWFVLFASVIVPQIIHHDHKKLYNQRGDDGELTPLAVRYRAWYEAVNGWIPTRFFRNDPYRETKR